MKKNSAQIEADRQFFSVLAFADKHCLERQKELLPCPFCGGTNTEIVHTHTASYWIECECGATAPGEYVDGNDIGHNRRAIANAVIAWNTRFSPKII